MTKLRDRCVPWWVITIIIVVCLPALMLPFYISAAESPMPENVKTFLWLFPFYLFVGGWLSWVCYGRRTYMTWILLVIMALTDVAMYLLVRL